MLTEADALGLKKLNFEILVLIRELVRRDATLACLMLGLEKEPAAALGSASLEQLQAISDTAVPLFHVCFGRTMFCTEIVQAAHEGDEDKINAAHLKAILYATRG